MIPPLTTFRGQGVPTRPLSSTNPRSLIGAKEIEVHRKRALLPAARATLAPCPAASRRAPPGASGPPRSRSEARRTSGSNGYRHGSSDAHAHDACPKRHPGMHAACPRRIAEDGRPTRAVTSGEEPAAAPSDGRGIGRSGRRRSLAAAGKRDRRYFRSTFPQHPDEHRPERGFSSQSITVGSQCPQRARSA